MQIQKSSTLNNRGSISLTLWGKTESHFSVIFSYLALDGTNHIISSKVPIILFHLNSYDWAYSLICFILHYSVLNMDSSVYGVNLDTVTDREVCPPL